MKLNQYSVLIVFMVHFFSCQNTNKQNTEIADTLQTIADSIPAQHQIQLKHDSLQQKVDVVIDDKIFTSYNYPDSLTKPVLYPLFAAGQTRITRNFPLEPKAGERIDHPHQVGLWFTYGDVNGIDFWNNSYAIPPEKKTHFGIIRHKEIAEIQDNTNPSSLIVETIWMQHDSTPLLGEEATYRFYSDKNTRIIDRITKLTAKEDILFRDNKEGLIAMRLNRWFETPTDKPLHLTDAYGMPSETAVVDTTKPNGRYKNSDGKSGEEVFGTRCKWTNLSAKVDGKKVTIGIMDHPKNPGYPACAFTRGYGLYGANNLGQKIFTKGKDTLNFALPKGKTAIFKHRIIIHSGEFISDEDMEKHWETFTQ